MSASWAEITREVEKRASYRCEYCRMHQSLQGATFHIEHVVPSSKSGSDASDNLALACPSCNLKKSNRTTAVDQETGVEVALFNPRTERWDDHFCWQSYTIVGKTPTGRALVAAFELNNVRRQLIRQAEEFFDLFPP